MNMNVLILFGYCILVEIKVYWCELFNILFDNSVRIGSF